MTSTTRRRRLDEDDGGDAQMRNVTPINRWGYYLVKLYGSFDELDGDDDTRRRRRREEDEQGRTPFESIAAAMACQVLLDL